jgi:hypothetical protein
MSIFSNLIACSNLSSSRTNEFNFSCQYPNSVVLPKTVSLSKAVITNSLLTFKSNQVSIFMIVDANIEEFKIANGYYDTVAELISSLNTIPGITSAGLIFSFSQLTETIKITKTVNTNDVFTLKGFSFDSATNVVQRLGFNLNQDYVSYLEAGNQVIYASAPVKLIRTNGFFVCSNLSTVPTACPGGITNIVDFIPIQTANLQYGDLIVLDRSNISRNFPATPLYNNNVANSTFQFQILDDEFNAITDSDKGLNTILVFNLDYD